MKIPSYSEICKPDSGAGAFFASILVWGVGIGCFAAVFNNFLVEIHDVSGVQRGLLEFLRETPGVLLVAILAALQLAQVKMMLGDVAGAENDCIECLRIDPKNAAGLVLMGNLLTNMKGDDAAAEQYYVRAVEADDGFATAQCAPPKGLRIWSRLPDEGA